MFSIRFKSALQFSLSYGCRGLLFVVSWFSNLLREIQFQYSRRNIGCGLLIYLSITLERKLFQCKMDVIELHFILLAMTTTTRARDILYTHHAISDICIQPYTSECTQQAIFPTWIIEWFDSMSLIPARRKGGHFWNIFSTKVLNFNFVKVIIASYMAFQFMLNSLLTVPMRNLKYQQQQHKKRIKSF